MDTSKLVREASELGLKPGFFPDTILVEGVYYHSHHGIKNSHGDLVAVVYFTASGNASLHILND